jgi:carbamate kinase
VTPLRDPRLLVVALGGRALRAAGHRAVGPGAWLGALERCLPPLADVAVAGFRLVVAHDGESPEDRGRRADGSRRADPPLSLDVRGAQVQGALGYAIQQALANLCRRRGVDVPIAAVVTRVGVDADDPAFGRPSRPVGPAYSATQARRLERERGWSFAGSAARGHRRVVPVPRPRRLLDADALRRLSSTGVLVAAGAGRVPTIETPDGHRGVEAILQPDTTAALLGTALGADRLVFLTGVDRVEVAHRTPRAIAVERLSVAEARAFLMASEFPSGSMGPKIEAAIDFVQSGGREAIITSLSSLVAALDGREGTRIVP